MFDDYVSQDSTPLYRSSTGSGTVCHLLWGDGVRLDPAEPVANGRRKVTARGGRPGWVRADALGGVSLLELYVIDVGQGDGLLLKTPGFRHVMIDGGNPRSRQDTHKNAADFVDWKFAKDYGADRIELDALVASHCDADHYGGLWDLLDVAQNGELDASGVCVEAFYHAGLSWWAKEDGRWLGPSRTTGGASYWTQLLEDRSAVEAALEDDAEPRLAGWWRDFLDKVAGATTRDGAPTPIARLSHVDGHLPGFGPEVDGEPVIRVLGPVQHDGGGGPVLRRFSGGTSTNTNGVSLLLRVDFGRVRILLTGDLNKKAQQALLDDYRGNVLEFQCDVAKACHHGSEDVSYAFLQAMRAGATVISSGDNEGYDHPRPSIVAASAVSGYLQVDPVSDALLTPLIYSTELARSVDLGSPVKVETRAADGVVSDRVAGADVARSTIVLEKTKRRTVPLAKALVVGGLVYGLVNVRTDGERILMATLDESSTRWRIESFRSRF